MLTSLHTNSDQGDRFWLWLWWLVTCRRLASNWVTSCARVSSPRWNCSKASKTFWIFISFPWAAELSTKGEYHESTVRKLVRRTVMVRQGSALGELHGEERLNKATSCESSLEEAAKGVGTITHCFFSCVERQLYGCSLHNQESDSLQWCRALPFLPRSLGVPIALSPDQPQIISAQCYQQKRSE